MLLAPAVLAVVIVAGGLRGTSHPHVVTSASGAFTISGTVSELEPGTSTQLDLNVSNPDSTQLNIYSVSASLDSTNPAYYVATNQPVPVATADTCASYLSPSLPNTWTTWTGWPTPVSGGSATTPGTASFSVPLSMTDSHTDQDACQGIAFNFNITATAFYTDPTTTGITAAPSVSPGFGAPVTLTATVLPTYSGVAPTGSVTFSGPNGQIGSSPLGACPSSPTPPANAQCASITTTTLPAGSNQITAVYDPSGAQAVSGQAGADFYTSNASMNQSVDAYCVNTPMATAATKLTGSSKGNLEVRSGMSVWLNGGTITGNVTVDAGGQFAATGGTITGNLVANGSTEVQGTAIGGNAQSNNAAMSLGYGTTVTGNVQPNGGGPFCASSIKVGNNLNAQNLASSTPATICFSTISGNLQYQSSSEPVQIGGSPSCGGNTVGGNMIVQNNSGPITVGAPSYGNTVAGNTIVQGNTGGGTLSGNQQTGGSCTLQSNTPGVVGSGNTVPSGKTTTCNRTA